MDMYVLVIQNKEGRRLYCTGNWTKCTGYCYIVLLCWNFLKRTVSLNSEYNYFILFVSRMQLSSKKT